MLSTPDTKNCMYVYWNLYGFSANVKEKEIPSAAALSVAHTEQLTNHMVKMKPTVPMTRMGGKSLTVSKPLLFRMVKAVVFANAMVGI